IAEAIVLQEAWDVGIALVRLVLGSGPGAQHRAQRLTVCAGVVPCFCERAVTGRVPPAACQPPREGYGNMTYPICQVSGRGGFTNYQIVDVTLCSGVTSLGLDIRWPSSHSHLFHGAILFTSPRWKRRWTWPDRLMRRKDA